MRRTKIVCTIGPATREPDVLRRMIRAGMDVARLNLAHGSREEHAENVDRIRALAKEEGRPVAIQIDLQGPKLRMGEMVEGGVRVCKGKEVTLTTEDLVGQEPSALPVQNENLPSLVHPDDPILIDDGLIELRAIEVSERAVRCRVRVGGTIQSNKGINLPGVSAELPSVTDKDTDDLKAALGWGVDWVALSFVRSADDVHKLRHLIAERTDEPLPIMAKIEKPQALEHLQAIVDAADAVMVARGDLGIEIPPEKVPMAQKRIISACNEAGIPVVTATQMLDSMIRNPRPTRAEAADVANAILDGTDAVMLSGETSIGSYPLQAVRTMGRIADEVEAHRDPPSPRPFRPVPGDHTRTIANALGHSVRDIAHDLSAAALLAPTASGYTARVMSRYRPDTPIVAVTPDVHVQRRLMLYWGVIPLLSPRADDTDQMIRQAVQAAREHALVQDGDTVLITAGAALSQPGTTNLVRVYVVGEEHYG
ncbi:MAG: pyruvate kinase [Anaerolineae bacterium]